MRSAVLVAEAGLVAFVGAACSGDDDEATTSTTTPVVTTSVTAPTTAATTAPTVTAAAPTTTEPSSTTSPEDALKAQIGADFVAATDRFSEMVEHPSLDGLEERAAHVAAQGSPNHDTVVARVRQLVTLGDRMIPNDPPSGTTAAPTTIVPTSTTSPEDALKAQIDADYVASTDRYFELVNQPSVDGLEDRAAHVAAPGSPYYVVVIAKVQQLVTLGDRIIPNDPPIRKVVVEHVELVGPPPYSKAVVTVCAVDNGLQLTPPEHTPDSQQVIEDGTAELVATRTKQEMWQTTQGWLPALKFDEADQAWTGVDSCPAE